jgi:hypothetical protein
MQPRDRRELSTEVLTLLANRETIRAYRELNRAVGRLESFARGIPPDVMPDEWNQAVNDYEKAFDLFYACARSELGVPGDYLPLDRASDITPEEWIKSCARRRQAAPRKSHDVNSCNIIAIINPHHAARFSASCRWIALYTP